MKSPLRRGRKFSAPTGKLNGSMVLWFYCFFLSVPQCSQCLRGFLLPPKK